MLHCLHVALFNDGLIPFCTFACITLFPCYPFFVLHFSRGAIFSSCTFFVFHIFTGCFMLSSVNVVLFSCYIFFILISFHVALFLCVASCCTHFMLLLLRVALISCCTFPFFTFFVLPSYHIAYLRNIFILLLQQPFHFQFSVWTFTFDLFLVLLFSWCTFFSLCYVFFTLHSSVSHSFYVALFPCRIFLMLHSFHNTLAHGSLPCCTHIMMRSFKAAIFSIAIFSCCRL